MRERIASSLDRLARVGVYPRRMREPIAAYYLGVSETQFRAGCERGVYPPSTQEGGMIFWLKDHLDQFIDRQFGVALPKAANDAEAEKKPDLKGRFGRA